MEKIKEADNYRIFKKRSGRFAVTGKDGKFINADEKVKILVSEGLVKTKAPAPKAEEPKEEAPAAEEDKKE